MDLGELVHVDPADEVAQLLREREYRQLDEVEVADERIEDLELVRMDEVLGIVQRDAGEPGSRARLVVEDRG